MKVSITATQMDISQDTPIVFRGKYETAVPEIKKIGFDAVEPHIHDSDQFDRQAFKALLEQNSLDLAAIGTGSAYGKDHIFLSSDDPQIRKKAVERIKGHITTAADYPHAVVIIGLIRGKIADCSNKKNYEKNLLNSLEICAAFAEEHHVVMGIELVNRYEADFLNTISQGLDFISNLPSPALKLHIDTFHLNIEERSIGDAILSAKDQICHVHLADSDRWHVGHGHYDFKETFSALKSIGYAHALSIESFNYPDSIISATLSHETIRDLWENA